MQAYIKLKKHIDSKGIRQNFIAGKTRISTSRLNMMLNGKLRISADDLANIAKTIDFDLNILKETKKETTE